MVSRERSAFVGKGSLDLLDLRLCPEQRVLLAISTRRVMAFGPNGMMKWVFDAVFPLRRVLSVQPSDVALEELDTGSISLAPQLRILDLESGAMRVP